jgi:hypothetical protein
MRIQKSLKRHYKKFLFNRQDCKRSETIILNINIKEIDILPVNNL